MDIFNSLPRLDGQRQMNGYTTCPHKDVAGRCVLPKNLFKKKEDANM